MNPASQPINSKFYLSRIRQALVHRPRLLNQLRIAVQRLLILVSAPAGFGKTTLLTEWATRESQLVVWFSLDSGDNDPAEFARNLAYAFESFQVSDAASLTSPDKSLPPHFILQTLLSELDDLATDTVLVLDDYHIIQSPLVHELLSSLLDHLPNHLHLVINDRGELLNVQLTPGNVDDRKPVPELVKKLFGKLFGDKGYISQPLVELLGQTFGIQMVTKLKSNSKNRLPMTLIDRILLRKRAIVESVIDQLKNISQIEHSRHRSVVNFMVNLLSGLIAYAHQPKKPSLGRDTLACLPA